MFNTIKELGSLKYIKSREIIPYSFIIFLTWISRFLLSNSLGLYEDDWHFSGNAITNTFAQNIDRISSALFTFWQGRPLHMTFLTFIPFLGAKLGGITTIYLIGFSILSVNACLWYSLLKKITQQPYLPIISTLLFCLYPADTTFNYLQHLIGLQTSLLLFLIAFHLFVSEASKNNLTKIFSYVFLTLSLLTYESLFPLFLIAPLLPKNRSNKKQWFYHIFILVFILVIYFSLRKLAGEQRVNELTLIELIQKLGYQVIVGPFISLKTFFLRLIEVIATLKMQELAILIISASVFFIVIHYLVKNGYQKDNQKAYSEIFKFLVIGILMTVLAYPSEFLLSVDMVDGRASRVHFAAALGTTIIVGCLWSMFLVKTHHQKQWNRLIILLLSIHLSLLFTFALNIQSYYKLSWQYQQAFWSDVLKLAPDFEERTVILVQAPSLPWGKQINPFDWSVPSVLESIYQFPKNWKFKPRLYVINPDLDNPNQWKSEMIKNQQFFLSGNNRGLRYYYAWEPERIVKAQDVILLIEKNKKLVRKPEITLADGHSLLLKQDNQRNLAKTYPKSIIFDRLIPSSQPLETTSHTPIYFDPQQ
jgi:hypothetical protein